MKDFKVYLFLTLILVFTSVSWITSCTHKPDISDIPEICFEGDILPIFQNSCAISGCHDGNGESDLVLNTYQSIVDKVEPGNSYASKIYQVITTTSGEEKMPPDQPLSTDNRSLIKLWIDQGAKQTSCPDK